MINVTVFIRKDCHLCEEVIDTLNEIQTRIPHNLVLIDIDEVPSLRDQFLLDIPVVETGPYRLKYPFSEQELEMTLSASQDRKNHLEKIGSDNYERVKARSEKISRADSISY